MKKMVVIGMVLCVLTVLVGSASALSFANGGSTGNAGAFGTGISGADVTSTAVTGSADFAGVAGGHNWIGVGAGDGAFVSVGTTSVAEGTFSGATAQAGVQAGSIN